MNPSEPPAGVIEEVSANDGMYGDRDHYRAVGQSALKSIRLTLLAARKAEVTRVLDFPCGHGRVLRMLKAEFPDAEITACDIDRDGVDFCAETFGAIPVYSDEDPADVPVEGPFDLIWCGSLLTHLDAHRWPGFLSLFESVLAEDGVLVFTVHGRNAVRMLRDGKLGVNVARIPKVFSDHDEMGFGYADFTATPGYGISLSSRAWVCSMLERFPNLDLLTYLEGGFGAGGLQDSVGVKRA